jgi:hypothetical protein
MKTILGHTILSKEEETSIAFRINILIKTNEFLERTLGGYMKCLDVATDLIVESGDEDSINRMKAALGEHFVDGEA